MTDPTKAGNAASCDPRTCTNDTCAKYGCVQKLNEPYEARLAALAAYRERWNTDSAATNDRLQEIAEILGGPFVLHQRFNDVYRKGPQPRGTECSRCGVTLGESHRGVLCAAVERLAAAREVLARVSE